MTTFLVFVALILSAVMSATQRPQGSADARTILDAALAAHGGADGIGGATAIRFRDVAEGALYDQSIAPDPPYPPFRVEDVLVIDPHGERVFRHEKGPTYEQLFVIDGNDAWTVNPALKRAAPLSPGATLDSNRRSTRRLPALLVLEAAARAPFARVLGRGTYDGRPHDIAEVPFADGVVLRLWFDAVTHLLSKHERTYVDATLGDTVDETVFTGYAASGGIQMPSRYVVRRNTLVFRDARLLDVQINSALEEGQFRVPAGFERRTAEPLRPWHGVTRLSERVYVIEQVGGQNSNVMLIGLDDGVMVVDAPEVRVHRGLSERVIATIRRTFPGRPIRWVVPSHHHSDHGAGLRPYIAAGAAVITTPGNAAFVRRIAAAPFRLRPDGLAAAPRAPSIEIIEGKHRVVRSGSHVVELFDVGPEPHAQENVAVWLPAERILFLGDLFETGYRDDARWDGGGLLGQILARHKWDVDMLVTSHSRPRRMADLRAPETR